MSRRIGSRARVSLLVMVVAVAGLAAGGCGSDNSSSGGGTATVAGGSGAGLQKLRVVLFPTTDMAGFWYAQDKGVFKKNGLDVQAQIVTDATALTAALVSGKADVMHHALPSMAQARVGGLPIKLISGVSEVPKSGYAEVLVLKGKGINSFKDLSGKSGGVAAPQGILDLGTHNAIDQAGGNSKTFKSVPIAPPDQLAALLAGRVQAITLNDPFLAAAKKNAKVESLGNPFANATFTAPSASAFATEQTIATKGDALKRYQAALIEADAAVQADPALARKELAEHTELPAETLKTLGLPVYSGYVNSDAVRQVLSSISALGWLKKPLTEQDMVSAGAKTN